MNLLNKNIKECEKCGTKLQKYFQQYEIKMQGFTEIYKRCPNCLEIYKVILSE